MIVLNGVLKTIASVSALYMKYYLINYFKEKYESLSEEEKQDKPKISAAGMGVHPRKYGTIITSPKNA